MRSFRALVLLVGLVAGGIFVGAPAEAASTLFSDQVRLQQEVGSSRIYAVLNNHKYLLRSLLALQSYAYISKPIERVSTGRLDQYEDFKLIMSSAGPRVYLLTGGQKVWFPTEASFVNSGQDWADILFISRYDSRSTRNGQIVKTADDPKVYYLDLDKVTRAPFNSENDLAASGFTLADIVVVPPALLEGYTLTSPVDPETIEPPTPPTPSVLFSASSTTLSASALVSGTVRNKVLEIKLTAITTPVTVTGITITKHGFLTDSDVTDVFLQDSQGFYLANPRSFVGGQAAFTLTKPLVVDSEHEQTISVLVSLASNSQNLTAASFSIDRASDIKSSGQASGSFPLSGPTWQIIGQSNALGSLTVSSIPISSSARQISVGSSNNVLNTFEFNVPTAAEDIWLDKINFSALGLSQLSYLSNWKATDDSGRVITTSAVTNGSSQSLTFSPSYKILRGSRKQLSVRADIVGGEYNNLQLVIVNNYDLQARGVNTGFAINVTPVGQDTNWPLGDGNSSSYNAINIIPGQAAATLSTTTPRTPISRGSQDVVLATLDVRTLGSDLSWQRLDFTVLTSGPNTPLAGTIKFRPKGGTPFGSADATGTGTRTVWFSTPPTLTPGKTLTVEILGSVSETATALDAYALQISRLEFVPKLGGSRIILSATIDTPSRPIQVVEVAVRQDPIFLGGNVVAGRTAVKVGRILIRTGSGEGVLIDSLTLSATGSNVSFANGYANLKLAGVNIPAPTGSPYVFALKKTISAATETALDLYVDSGLNTDGDVVQFNVTNVIAHGATSKATIPVQIVGATTPAVVFTASELAGQVDPSFVGGVASRVVNTVLGQFIITNNSAEDIATANYVIKEQAGSAGMNATRGYKSLRLINAATGSTISSTVLSPLGGSIGDLLKSGFTVKKGTSLAVKIVADTRLAPAGDILKMMVTSATATGNTSHLGVTIEGLPWLMPTVATQ